MAKRVNTKFVVILGGTLAAAGMGVAGLMWVRHHKPPVDPKVSLPLAEAAEKSGELAKAVDLYIQTADAMDKLHETGSDQHWAKAAELALAVAEKSKTPEEGVHYLQLHAKLLQQAQAVNPRNKEVNEKLIDESHELALMRNIPTDWVFLEEQVSRYLSNQSAAPARMYALRGEARLQRTEMMVAKDITESRMRDIDQDLKKAIEMDPDSGNSVALYARYQQLDANRKQRSSTPDEADALRAAAQKSLKDFLAKHPNDPDVTREYVTWLARPESLALLTKAVVARDPQLHEQLIQQYMETLPDDAQQSLKDILKAQATDDPRAVLNLVQHLLADQTVQILTKAVAAHPTVDELGVQLNQAYLQTTPPQVEQAEKVIHDMVAAHPNDPLSYLRLGEFYRFKHDLPKALATYKEGLTHINLGGWGMRRRHDVYQGQLYYNIASLDMDIAATAGVGSAEGKAAMTDSMDFSSKFRTAHGARGLLDLLDGRARLLNGDLPEAIALLHSAETNLANSPQSEYMRITKVMLAEASQLQRPPQLGAALDYLKEACAIQPVSSTALLQQASVLNQLGRFDEAKVLLDDLLRQSERLPTALIERAKTILALSQAGLGIPVGTADTDTVPALLQAAQIKIGTNELDDALATLNRVLEKDDGNALALRLAAVVQMRLGKKDEAIKLVDRALTHYKDNPEFQYLRAVLQNDGEKDPDKAQMKLIESISDEYVKQLMMWAYYSQRGNVDGALAALQKAEASVGDVNLREGKLRQDDIIDRLFSTSMTAAMAAQTDADKKKYWDMAQSYQLKAERFNLDGVNGLLYRGRMEFVKSSGASGLALIEKAVADQPDYAQGHNFLAQAYLALKVPKVDAALQELRLALHLVPNDILLLRQTIRLLLQMPTAANVQEAQTLLKQGLAISPTDPGLAEYADMIGDRTQAIARRETIAKSNPSDLVNLRRLSLLYAQPTANGQKPDPAMMAKAIAIVEPLAHREKADLSDIVVLATMYAESGAKDKALALFEPLVAPTVDAQARYQSLQVLGEFCKNIREPKLAETYLKEAVSMAKDGDDSALRHLGDFYFDTDDIAHAEPIYRTIFDQAKTEDLRAGVRPRLIEVMIRGGKFADAESMLDSQILKQNPADLQGLVLRAFSKIQQKDYSKALEDLKVVLDKSRNQPQALYYRALANIRLRTNLEPSAADLLTLVDHYPDVLKYRVLLAQVDRQLHKYGEAAVQFDEILSRQPELVGVRRDYVGFLLGLVMVQQRTAPDSLEPIAITVRRIRPVETLQTTLQDAIKMEPDESSWVMMYGDLATLVGDTKLARRIYEAVYKSAATPGKTTSVAGSDNPACVNAYARLLVGDKDYDLAVLVTSAFIEKHSDIADIYLRRATAYAGLKKDDDARKDVDRAFSIALDEAQHAKDYTGFFTAINQARDALTASGVADRLRIRISANPDDFVSGVGLLHMLVSINQPAEAIALSKSLKVPAGDVALQTVFLREAATALLEGGDLNASDARFRELFKVSPDDIEGLNNYAFMLAENMKKTREALPYAERAVKLIDANPDEGVLNGSSGNIYDTLGWVRYLNGDVQGAIEMLQRSIEVLPASQTYLHLAEAYKKAHRDTDEKMAVDEGLKLAPKDDPLQASFQKLKAELGN